MAHALLITKSHVSAFTRKDGAFVAAHDDKRVAASITSAQGADKPNKRVVSKLKKRHKSSASDLKSTLSHELSSGNTEYDDGSKMTYGHFKDHLHTMRSQLGKDSSHSAHLEHAQYAANQAMGNDSAPISDKHAKLFGAALGGKTNIDSNGMVRHAASANKKTAPSSGNIGDSERAQYGDHFKEGDKVKDNYGKHHEVLSHVGAEVKTKGGESFHPTKVHRVK